MVKSLNKGISSPIGILIILICALLIGEVLIWQLLLVQKEEEITPEPTPPESETEKEEKTELPQPKRVEKEVFVDMFLDERATFNISWEQGGLEINLVRPDGTVITKKDAETNPNIQWSVTSWRTYVTIHVFEPESGTWKVRGIPINDIVPEFTVTLTGRGTWNMDFVLVSDEDSYVHRSSLLYPYAEPPLIWGVVDGPPPYSRVKGVEMFGTVLHPNGERTAFRLYDDGLEEHGDVYPNDGLYANYFKDFSSSGFYRFEMTVQNVRGTRVEASDLPYITLPPSTPVPKAEPVPVPPFTRTADLTIEIK